ncbi:hypothetical protein F7725_007051 [Dissostichus mawsoni]|uniref:Uncharacterized protein n=1 Tax=Dissostichus mawsoni TaxID=36200 RepID=A0A7J5XXF2_DISMA|nr:hypothetical protein F7725_007051 [Dissostichus mawsoni]
MRSNIIWKESTLNSNCLLRELTKRSPTVLDLLFESEIRLHLSCSLKTFTIFCTGGGLVGCPAPPPLSPEAEAVIPHQDVAGRRAVEPYISHLDVSFHQTIPNHTDDVFRSHLQCGEVSSSMDGDNLSQDFVQSLHLLKGQVVEPLLCWKLHHPHL